MAILVKRFDDWLKFAAPGEVYQYHRGRLVHDRFDINENGDPVPNELDVLASAAYSASQAGLVDLFQIRGKRDSIYLAKRKLPAAKDTLAHRMKDVPYRPAAVRTW